MAVLIENINDTGDQINSVVVEPLYSGDVSSVKSFTVVGGDISMSGVTFTPYDFNPSDIEPTFTPASAGSYQYITLSDDNTNFYSTLTENFTPLEEKVLYIKATIPSDAEIGTWECGLNECYDDGTSNQPITGFEDWKHYATLPVTGGDEVMDWIVDLTLEYIEGAMSYYFYDVRFALSDGTELDYERVSVTEGDEATYKIQLEDVPVTPTVTNIYVLFGNDEIYEEDEDTELGDNPEVSSGFTPVWNDNFDDASIDTSKWTSSTPVGSITESSGTMNISISSGVNADWWGGSIENAPIIYAGIPTGDFEAKVKISSYTPAAYKHVGMILYEDRDNAYIFGQSNTTIYLEKIVEDSGSDISGVSNSTIPLWLKISYIEGVVTFSYSTDDSTYTSFTSFTSEFTPEYVGLVAKNWQTYPSVDVSFDDFEVYDAYEIAQPSTGSLGSTQLNGHVYEKDLTIWGKVLYMSPESDIEEEEDLVVINIGGMRSIGTTDFEITKRANDKASSFQMNYRTTADNEFNTGDDILLNSGVATYLEGMIEEVTHDLAPANKRYSISGKDKAAQLTKQLYSLDGSIIGTGVKGSVINSAPRGILILEGIVSNTDIKVGPCSDLEWLEFVNHCHEWTVSTGAWFFGDFKSKKVAIDFLCSQAGKRTGKTYQWFVDNKSVLNVYSIEDKIGQSYITLSTSTPRLVNLQFKDSISGLINKQTGYFGENEESNVTIQDSPSIILYGIHQGENLHDSGMNQSEMSAELQDNIDRLAYPIYTITATVKRFVEVEPGQPIYTDVVPGGGVMFIVSDVILSGQNAFDMTQITATTDTSVFSEDEEVEVIKIVAQDSINESKATVGTVSSVLNDGTVGVTTWGTGGSLSAKDINAN